jgi:hypothetical protein
MQIWRFPVEPGVRSFFLSVPEGSLFMSLVDKGGEPQLYFKVPDPEAGKMDLLFFVVPTGIDLTPEEEQAQYLGSFTVALNQDTEFGNTLVFHVLAEVPAHV